jgi:formylglycine-generating enzyme required for sulfatase activity
MKFVIEIKGKTCEAVRAEKKIIIMKKKLKRIKQSADYSAMESDTIQKNEVKPEPLNRILLRIAGNVALVALLIFTVCKTSAQRHPAEPEMIKVKGGTFTMGCTAEQGSDCYDNAKPAHSVTMRSFQIGKYEITQAQWKAIMGNNPSNFKEDNLPVENVSWNDVQEFVLRLNVVTGKNYRLPTEAEWEYAARGGNRSKGYKYSGSNNLDEVAWFGNNSDNQIHPVGTKKANELGIHDMSGNVDEWCIDWYDDYFASFQQNPAGASSGSSRVNRGGGWDGSAVGCHVAYRGSNNPDDRNSYLGFRVVLLH